MARWVATAATTVETLVTAAWTPRALAVIGAFTASEAGEITNRALGTLHAGRVIGGIAGPTETLDTLVASARSHRALIVGHARAAHQQVGIADGRFPVLLAVGVIIGTTRRATLSHALFEIAGPLVALAIPFAGPTAKAVGVTEGQIRALDAGLMRIGIALPTTAVHASVPRPGTKLALGVAQTRSALGGVGVADGVLGALATALVIIGRTELTEAVDAFVEETRSNQAFGVGRTKPA